LWFYLGFGLSLHPELYGFGFPMYFACSSSEVPSGMQ
ncbi:hypothetical protein A2U01_0083246, partial [Trifolium medium]|nr:hypothetical protein [Trifolium medium]